MYFLAIEIGICVALGIGLIIVLVYCTRNFDEKEDDNEKRKLDFLSISVNEEYFIRNLLISYYEQQRNELVERQKIALDESTTNTSALKNGDSGYSSMFSPIHSPHMIYEYSGFASLDELQVSNPLFENKCQDKTMKSPSTIK